MQRKGFAALVCLLALLFCVAGVSPTKVTKQEGGFTGDSVVVADTSARIWIRGDVTGLWMRGHCDSTTIFYLQAAPGADTTHWVTVDSLAVAKGWAGVTDDWGKKFNNCSMRVIQLCDSASTTGWGNAWVVTVLPD